jgi:hypothetical protein
MDSSEQLNETIIVITAIIPKFTCGIHIWQTTII